MCQIPDGQIQIKESEVKGEAPVTEEARIIGGGSVIGKVQSGEGEEDDVWLSGAFFLSLSCHINCD